MLKSIINAAKEEMDFTLSLDINEKSSSTIARNIYECFRMLGDGLLITQGISSIDHVEPINALIGLSLQTPRSLQVLHTYRRIRHNINYYGYLPSTKEAEDMVDFSNKCFFLLYRHIHKLLEQI